MSEITDPMLQINFHLEYNIFTLTFILIVSRQNTFPELFTSDTPFSIYPSMMSKYIQLDCISCILYSVMETGHMLVGIFINIVKGFIFILNGSVEFDKCMKSSCIAYHICHYVFISNGSSVATRFSSIASLYVSSTVQQMEITILIHIFPFSAFHMKWKLDSSFFQLINLLMIHANSVNQY